MASLTGQLVAETYKALLKLIDNDILTASEKQITDGFGGGSNVFIDSQGFLRANKYKVTNGLATQFLKADGSLDANAYLTSITGAQVITALGYTPVPTTRTITINGETHDLSANNSWTIAGTSAVWGNITGILSNQTDLQNALNAKVPYTGATANVDLGENALLAEYLSIDTATTHVTDVGEIVWNAIDGTFDMGLLNGVTLQVGQELHFYGKAVGAIGNGQAVMFAGVEGDHLLMSLADAATINANPQYFIGIATQDFANNDFGYVTVLGKVRNLDTTAYPLGAVLYYDSTNAIDGKLTTTMPIAPNAKIEVAAVVRVHATQGILMVRPHIMPKLNQIQDVYIADPANNHGIFYDLAAGYWRNTSIATALGYTPQAQLNGTGFVKVSGTTISYDNSTYLTTADAASTYLALTGGTLTGSITATSFVKTGGTSVEYLKADGSTVTITGEIISGSGTAGYIPKFSSSIVLGNSLLYDNGTSLGIGTSTLNYGGYGRTLTGAAFASTAFGFEAVTGSTTDGNLIGGLSLVIANNDASRRIGSQIQSYISGATATNQGADLRFYVKPDAGVLLEIVRMTSGGITFNKDLTATNITATAFIKSGGLSNEFLMADGSVTTYTNPVTGTGSAGYIPKWTTAANIGSSLIYEDGTSIGIAYTTPNKGGYGRTLTGAAFASASFGFEAVGGTTTNGGLVGGLSFILSQNDASRIVGSAIQSNLVGTTATNYGADLRFYAKADAGVIGEVARMTSAGLRVYGTIIKDGGTSSQYLMADGSVSTGPDLSGYLPLSGGTMTGQLTFSSQGSKITFGDSTSASPMMIGEGLVDTFGTDSDFMTLYFRNSFRLFSQLQEVGRFTNTGLRVYGTIVKDGGTSTQFLKADGSVDSNTYATTSALGNYLPLTGGTMSGVLYGNGSGNFYIYNYGRIGLPNAGRIIYNNGTGSNMFFGEIASDVYGFTGNLYSDTPTISMNVSSKRVGIGTALAQVPLDIFSETTSTSNVVRYSYNSSPASYFLNLGTIVSSGLVKWTYDQVNAGATYSNVMTFDRGSVVFGGVNPTGKLTVQSGADGNMFSIRGFIAGYNYPNVVEMGVSGADGYINVRDGAGGIQTVISGYSGTPNYFNASVLIGTNVNAGYKLDVNGYVRFTSTTAGYVYLNAVNSGGNEAGVYYQIGNVNKWEQYTAANDGNMNFWSNGNGIRFYITPTGGAYFSNYLYATRYVVQPNGTGQVYNIVNANSSYAGSYTIQAGEGSSGYGGSFTMWGHSHASRAGFVSAGISSGSNGKFTVMNAAIGAGSDVFTVDVSGNVLASGIITASAGINFISTVRMRWGGNNTPALGFPFGGSDTGNSLFIEAADGDTGGIAINNDGVTVYGAADTGFVFRAIDEDSYQSGVGLAAATTFQVSQGTNGGGYLRGNFNIYNGSAYADAFYENSDFRLKTLIENNPIISGIENLQAKLYTKNGKTELGYFAQDAEKLMPYAVEKGADGFLSLSYREIHTAKIARLEQRVAELEKQLNLN